MSVQSFDDLAILLQMMQTTRNLAQSMITNAATWVAMANAQSPVVATLAKFMNDAAAAYLNIIATATAWVNANNAQATAAVGLIGATLSDLSNYAAPLKTAATSLQSADKSTYAACISACNALTAAVTAPATIYGN